MPRVGLHSTDLDPTRLFFVAVCARARCKINWQKTEFIVWSMTALIMVFSCGLIYIFSASKLVGTYISIINFPIVSVCLLRLQKSFSWFWKRHFTHDKSCFSLSHIPMLVTDVGVYFVSLVFVSFANLSIEEYGTALNWTSVVQPIATALYCINYYYKYCMFFLSPLWQGLNKGTLL